MTKSLTLMRHGKSSWKHDVDDHDRPLRKRAYNDIKLVADRAKPEISSSVKIYSSSANRALTTAKCFAKHLDLNSKQLQIKPELYTFNVQELKQFIYTLDDGYDEVMIFGHNPAFTMLANNFGDKHFDNVPTSGLVNLSFENTSWKDCKKGKTTLHLFPKNLRT